MFLFFMITFFKLFKSLRPQIQEITSKLGEEREDFSHAFSGVPSDRGFQYFLKNSNMTRNFLDCAFPFKDSRDMDNQNYIGDYKLRRML